MNTCGRTYEDRQAGALVRCGVALPCDDCDTQPDLHNTLPTIQGWRLGGANFLSIGTQNINLDRVSRIQITQQPQIKVQFFTNHNHAWEFVGPEGEAVARWLAAQRQK